MQACVNKTYISKRQIAQYKEQRAAQSGAQEKVKKPAVEEEKKEEGALVKSEQPQMKQGLFSFGAKAMNLESEQELDRNLSCEEVDSDDLAGGLCDSDSEDGAERRGVFKAMRSEKRAKRGGGGVMALAAPKRQKYAQEFDTNVFEVKLSCLASQKEVATGDAELCQVCKGVFSKLSNLTTEGGQQIWQCEFCNQKNEVMIDDEEVPKTNEVTYLIEAPAQVQEKKMSGQDISVIFCLDISGSMCVSQAIEGKHKIKGDNISELNKNLKKFGDGSDQFLSNAEKNKTYVSRIQCVKAAIENQIQDMSKGAAQRKVGIVTFNNEVTVIGDGSKNPQTITGDKLDDIEFLKTNGKAQGKERLQKPVAETDKVLLEKLAAIEETGPTALGPAIITSVCMAAEGSKGSTVVICTDGLANIGLGAFDECVTQEDMQKADTFYEIVGQIAQTAGVTINIISIEGDECNIDSLSKLAEASGGIVERVNPTTLTQNFASMLSIPVIATNVEAKVKIHKGLQFRNEIDKDVSEDKTILVKQFGNVTSESVFTFEYGLKPISQLLQMNDIDLEKIKSFPFQTQISYTALDGSKCLRVITQSQEVCNEREEVEEKANYEMLSFNCMNKGSAMARAGNMSKAQAIMKGFKRGIARNQTNVERSEAVNDFNEKLGSVYAQMGDQLHELSDSEEAVLSKAPKMEMIAESEELELSAAPKKRGGFSSLFSGFGSKSKQPAAQTEVGSMAKSKKMKAPASKFAGKQSDSLATELYQMSNQAQMSNFRKKK